jgi:membrane-associated protease RseP (regulator of RpoE activity)
VAFFSEDRAGAFAMTEVDGSIGERIAERFRIFLDYAHDRLILEPVGPAGTGERAFSGASFEASGPGYRTLRVRKVADDGAAARAGLEPGDVIVSIDERDAADLTLDDVLSLLEKPFSRTIGVRRGSTTRVVTLTPEPLA